MRNVHSHYLMFFVSDLEFFHLLHCLNHFFFSFIFFLFLLSKVLVKCLQLYTHFLDFSFNDLISLTVGLLPTVGLASSSREMQLSIGESGAESGENGVCILDFTVFVGVTSCYLILFCKIGQQCSKIKYLFSS